MNKISQILNLSVGNICWILFGENNDRDEEVDKTTCVGIGTTKNEDGVGMGTAYVWIEWDADNLTVIGWVSGCMHVHPRVSLYCQPLTLTLRHQTIFAIILSISIQRHQQLMRS